MIRRTILSLALAFAATSAFAQSVPAQAVRPDFARPVPDEVRDHDFDTPPPMQSTVPNCTPSSSNPALCQDEVEFGGGDARSDSAIAGGRGSIANGVNSTVIGTRARGHGEGHTIYGSSFISANGTLNTGGGFTGVMWGTGNVCWGNNCQTYGNFSTLNGTASFGYGTGNAINGAFSGADGNFNALAGYGVLAQGNDNFLGGSYSFAVGNDNAMVGPRNGVNGNSNAGMGSDINIVGNDNVGAGRGVDINGNRSVAIGTQSQSLEDDCVALGSGAICDQERTVSVGQEGFERRITNVADGVEATDAVNVRQAQAWDEGIYNRSVQYTDLRFTVLNDRIDDLDNRLDKVGAMSAAQASLAASSIAASGGKGAFGVALGGYGSETAFAAGYSKAFRSSKGRPIGVTAQASHASGETAWGVAVSFGLR